MHRGILFVSLPDVSKDKLSSLNAFIAQDNEYYRQNLRLEASFHRGYRSNYSLNYIICIKIF